MQTHSLYIRANKKDNIIGMISANQRDSIARNLKMANTAICHAHGIKTIEEWVKSVGSQDIHELSIQSEGGKIICYPFLPNELEKKIDDGTSKIWDNCIKEMEEGV